MDIETATHELEISAVDAEYTEPASGWALFGALNEYSLAYDGDVLRLDEVTLRRAETAK